MAFFGKKYYLVSVDKITKAIWETGGYTNILLERVPASDFFLKNGIPKEFQKIVLMVPFKKRLEQRMKSNVTTKMNSYFCEELISGYSFCCIPSVSNSSCIRLMNTYIKGYDQLVSIDLDCDMTLAKDVKEFYIGLKSKGLLDGYAEALKQLFCEKAEVENVINNGKDALAAGYLKKIVG